MANERTKDTNPDPITGQPGAHPVVGGAIGAVAGGAAGKGAAETVNPTLEEQHWRQMAGNEYEQYAPAYRLGWESAARTENNGRKFDDVEKDLAKNWSKTRGTMKNEWSDVRQRTRAAFERAQNTTAPGITQASELDNKTKP
jgi:hypothetical protein